MTLYAHAQVEINASPQTVRETFLDFNSWLTWQSAWSIKPASSAVDINNVKPHDKLKVTMPGMSFTAPVEENTPGCFSWKGSLLGNVFTGQHWFAFRPSEKTPGGTTFVQDEEFGGYATAVLGWPWRGQTKEPPNWVALNAALKKEAEKREAEKLDLGELP